MDFSYGESGFEQKEETEGKVTEEEEIDLVSDWNPPELPIYPNKDININWDPPELPIYPNEDIKIKSKSDIVLTFILIGVILLFTLWILIGLGFLLMPTYLLGAIMALVWQFVFHWKRPFKDKFSIALYSWLSFI